MKTKLLILILFFVTTYSFGQTYSFSKLVKKANVQTSTGKKQRVIGSYQGPYKFVFQTPNDPQIKKIFILLEPGQNLGPGLPWYGLGEEMEYVEMDKILFRRSTYFDTGDGKEVTVLIAEDHSAIVILRKDGTIWEYSR